MAEAVKDISETHDYVYTVELAVQFHIVANEKADDWKQDIRQQFKERLIERIEKDDLPFTIVDQDYHPK